MVAVILCVYSAVLFLNGLQLLNKIEPESNWPTNLVGGLFGVVASFYMATGQMSESFVLLPQSDFGFVATFLCMQGLAFAIFGVSTKRGLPEDASGYFFFFTGVFSLLWSYGFAMKVLCYTLGIIMLFVGLLNILVGRVLLKTGQNRTNVGRLALVVAVFGLFVPGALMLTFDMVLP